MSPCHPVSSVHQQDADSTKVKPVARVARELQYTRTYAQVYPSTNWNQLTSTWCWQDQHQTSSPCRARTPMHTYICIIMYISPRTEICLHQWNADNTKVKPVPRVARELNHKCRKHIHQQLHRENTATWLIHMCAMTCLYVRHTHSITSVAKILTRSSVVSIQRHDSFICVTWLIHMCVTWLIYMRDMTHLYVWHDSFICVPWRVLMWDARTQSQVSQTYFRAVPKILQRIWSWHLAMGWLRSVGSIKL